MSTAAVASEVSKWKRQGQCTVGCGACCRFLRLQVPPSYYDDEDVRHWIELHGIKVKKIDGAAFVTLHFPCTALTADGLCGLYGMPQRPKLCSTWPMTPGSLEGVEDVCTYSFKETING